MSAEQIPVGRVAGYVMAGGASRRFGSDKALAILGGRTMLARVHALVAQATGGAIVVTPPGRYTDHILETIPDRWPDEGPLGGIITALRHTSEAFRESEWNLIVSCDMPFLSGDWLSHLRQRSADSAAEIVVPRSRYGLEPLCACWRTSSVESLQLSFDAGTRRVTEAMKLLRAEVLDEPHWKRFDTAGRLFWNMNTPEDYKEAARIEKMENA